MQTQLEFCEETGDLGREEWEELFKSYLIVYDTPENITNKKIDKSWKLIQDEKLRTLQARNVNTKELVGVAHFYPIINLRRGQNICYLDVLVVKSSARRQGVGTSLLLEIKRIATEEGLAVVRWVTGREDNDGPRKMYSKVAKNVLDMYQMEEN